jgi:hypothetical protein
MLIVKTVTAELNVETKVSQCKEESRGIYMYIRIYSTGKCTRNNKGILLWVARALLYALEYGTWTKREEMGAEMLSMRAVGHFLVPRCR